MTDRERLEILSRDLLRGSLATHRRRCAIRQGVRETDSEQCQHDWDLAMQWCQKCGLGKKDLYDD